MATPLSSSPPKPVAPCSLSASRKTRKATRLKSLATRPVGVGRLVIHVDLVIGKAYGPHRKKLRTYLGIVARNKVNVTYDNWKQVSVAQKDLIWGDIRVFKLNVECCCNML